MIKYIFYTILVCFLNPCIHSFSAQPEHVLSVLTNNTKPNHRFFYVHTTRSYNTYRSCTTRSHGTHYFWRHHTTKAFWKKYFLKKDLLS